MAKIHVLSGSGNNVYTVVVHAPTPAGNNSAGTLWADAIKNSGNATSAMTSGNGPGLITIAELNQVQAGTVIESTFPYEDDPTRTVQQRLDDIDLRASQMVADLLARYQRDLKYFGLVRT